MVIKGLGPTSTPYDQLKIQRDQERQQDDSKGVNKSPSAGRDHLSVSDDARLAGIALETAKNAPDTRADKVARLKAMVQDGSYKPNAEKIAGNMVAEDAELWE